MKKQESKQKGLKWGLLALVLLIIAAAAVIGVVLLGGSGDPGATEPYTAPTAPAGQTLADGKLYWNMERSKYFGTGITRSVADDGTVKMSMAVDGEQVRLSVADMTVANHMDTMQVMGLVFDEDGVVVDVRPVEEFTGGYAVKNYFVEALEGDTISCNNAPSYDGYTKTFTMDADTKVYYGGDEAALAGLPGTIAVDDEVIAIQDTDGRITHVYVIPYQEPMDIYWNVERMYSSTTGMTTRQPDALGYYEFLLAVNGEQVTLRTRDMEVANQMDATAAKSFGLEFDENGDIIGVVEAKIATRGSYFSSWYHVTGMNENVVSTLKIASGSDKGQSRRGTLSKYCKIFDVSSTAEMVGQQVDYLQVGDQIHGLTDSRGQVCVIFIISRKMDSDMYWNLERKWDSENSKTSRTPNAQGYYEILLAVNGEQVTLKTKDIDLVNTMDGRADMHFGLKVEDGIITAVYTPSQVTGGTFFASWYDVIELTEDGKVTAQRTIGGNSQGKVVSARMAEDCEIYNVSGVFDSHKGEKTTLRIGDRIHGEANVNGELEYIYVVNRIADSEMYWNVERKWDAENKVTTRTRNAQGYYEILLAVNGKQVTLKTKDAELVNEMDGRADRHFGLKLSGDVITRVYTPSEVTGGTFFASWCDVTAVSGGEVTALRTIESSNKGTSYTAKMASDCKIYNVSNGYQAFCGEATTLRIGDRIHGETNYKGELVVIYVVDNRTVDAELYWNVDRKWDSKNSVSTRQPNAEGWYEFLLAVNGKQVTLKTKDEAIVQSMDAKADRYFGLILDGDVITRYVHPNAVTGGSFFASWCDVTGIKDGSVTALRTLSGSNQGKSYTAKMAKGCKVYNVSNGYVNFSGEETTLRVGDQIQGQLNKNGELVVIYVVGNRTVEAELYWNVDRKWDSKNSVSTRQPNADGYYEFLLAVNGKQVTLKTKDADIVQSMDAKADRYFGLILDGDVITRYVHPDAVTGGSFFASWCDVTEIKDGSVSAVRNLSGSNQGKSYTAKMADHCKVYNVSLGGNFEKFAGEETTLRVGDRIQGQKNGSGELVVIYVVERFGMPYAEHTCEHVSEKVQWYAWNGKADITQPGHYVLTQDLTQTASRNISAQGQVVLCLNGHTITGSESNSVFFVRSGAKFTLCDHKKPDGTYAGTVTTAYTGLSGGVFYIFDGGEMTIRGGNYIHTGTCSMAGIGGVGNKGQGAVLNIYDGTFTGGTATSDGGVFALYEGAEMNLYDGTITGGTAKNGGNICLYSRSSLNMYGGTIANGTATSEGGNIRSASTSVIKLENGTIEGGTAANGGSIACLGGISISGGTVTGGTASDRGGNLYLWATSTSKAAISGGTVENGVARTGGNIWAGSGANKAEVTSYAKLEITGGTVQNGTAKGERGGNINVCNAAQATISGGSILGGTSETLDGGSIVVSRYDSDTHSDTVLNITGGTVTGGSVPGNGGAIWIYKTSLNITGGTVTGTASKQGGSLYVLDGTATIGGEAVITGGQASEGGNIYVNNKSQLTITGGLVEKGQAQSGGNIYAGSGANTAEVTSYAQVNITGGTVADGSATRSRGGNIAIINAAKATVSGDAVISGGTSSNDGGSIIVSRYDKDTHSDTSLTVTGGTIQGGTATGSGGTIWLYKSKLNITGGTIQGGTAKSGGAIHQISGDTTVGGTAVIRDGTATTGAGLRIEGGTVTLSGGIQVDSIYLNSGRTVTIGTDKLTNTTPIGIQMAKAGEFTTVTDPQDRTLFESVDPAYGVLYSNGKLLLASTAGEHVHCLCNDAHVGVGGHTGCELISWQAWTDPDSLPTDGSWYLDTDVTLTQAQLSGSDRILDVPAGKTLNLCLNGHTIENKVADRNIMWIRGHLNITDCQKAPEGAYKGVITSAAKNMAGMFYVFTNGTSATSMSIYGGNIISTATTASTSGGVIRVGNAGSQIGTLNLYDGVISGGTAAEGGSIYVTLKCVFNMYGGTVTGGTATGNGGNVYINTNASANLYGGTISGGIAANGGNLNTQGKVEMTGGSITGGYNTGSDREGGNVRIGGSGVFTLRSGNVENGGVDAQGTVQTKKGGNFQVFGTLNLVGGTVSGGQVSNQGGNIASWGGTVNISDEALVRGGIAAVSGGNIVINSANGTGKTTISGGTVTGGTAPKAAGVLIDTKGIAEISGTAKIVDNNGANLYLSTTGTLTVGALTEGASIGVTMQTPGVLGDTDCTAYIFSDDKAWQVVFEANKLELKEAPEDQDA